MLISLYLFRYDFNIMWPSRVSLSGTVWAAVLQTGGKKHCKMLTKVNLLREWCGLRPHTHTQTTHTRTPMDYRWGLLSNSIINTWQTTYLYRFFSWNLSSEEKRHKVFVISQINSHSKVFGKKKQLQCHRSAQTFLAGPEQMPYFGNMFLVTPYNAVPYCTVQWVFFLFCFLDMVKTCRDLFPKALKVTQKTKLCLDPLHKAELFFWLTLYSPSGMCYLLRDKNSKRKLAQPQRKIVFQWTANQIQIWIFNCRYSSAVIFIIW